VSRYQKGKTNLDFTKARDSEWQRHQLVHVQVCTSLQTDNHTSTPPLSFLQAGCPSCRPTNSVKALMSTWYYETKMVVMMMMMMMMMTAVHWLRCSGRCRAYSHRCNTCASARTHCAVIKTIKMLNTQWVKENPDENATLFNFSYTLYDQRTLSTEDGFANCRQQRKLP